MFHSQKEIFNFNNNATFTPNVHERNGISDVCKENQERSVTFMDECFTAQEIRVRYVDRRELI